VKDKIFTLKGKRIQDATVEYVTIDEGVSMGINFECDDDCKDCYFSSWETDWEGESDCNSAFGCTAIEASEFGKTVFLTREAAENALEGMKQ
jgi:hypothetical protein